MRMSSGSAVCEYHPPSAREPQQWEGEGFSKVCCQTAGREAAFHMYTREPFSASVRERAPCVLEQKCGGSRAG